MVYFTSFLYYTALVLCISVVGYLIYYDKDGWGWLLFAVLIIFNDGALISMKSCREE